MTKLAVTIILAVSMLYFADGARDFMASMKAVHTAQIERAVDGR